MCAAVERAKKAQKTSSVGRVPSTAYKIGYVYIYIAQLAFA